MTENDRGAYTPQTDAPLAFDARRSHGGVTSRAPIMMIISAAILIGLVTAMVMFYRSGVRGSGQAPQIVGAPVGDTKAPPPPSAQPADNAAGLQIYKSEATPPGEMKPPALVAPPEESAVRPAPPPVVVQTPAPAPVAPAQPAPIRVSPAQPAPSVTAKAPSAAPHLRETQLPPSPIDEAAVGATSSPTKAAASAAKPAASTAAKAAKAATLKPEVATPTGGVVHNVVQIGAFSSQALADKGWSDVSALLPGQTSGKTKKVEQTTKDGKLYYRTYVGGFASKDSADAFCASLKAAGKACFVK